MGRFQPPQKIKVGDLTELEARSLLDVMEGRVPESEQALNRIKNRIATQMLSKKQAKTGR